MSLQSDRTKFKADEKKLRKREGDPAGTHFAVVTLLIILVMVAMYFLATNLNETENSPTLASSDTPSSSSTKIQ